MNNLSAITKSFIFHGIVFAVVSGAFFFKSDEIVVSETPIEIAFVTDEKPAQKQEEKKPEPVKDTPPPIEDKPQPAPKALEQPKPKPKVEKAEKTEEKKVERVEPKPIEKKPEPKPEPKEEPKPKAEDKKDTEADFMSVLKNLQDSEPVDTKREGPKLTESPVVDRVTTGELNAFQRQLSNCWSILPGAAQAETLAVNLTINVNRDRTVRDVQITDKARYQSDPFFRAAADNAMRAIQHPDCTPLDLPPNKYTMWKEITLNFDPGRMF